MKKMILNIIFCLLLSACVPFPHEYNHAINKPLTFKHERVICETYAAGAGSIIKNHILGDCGYADFVTAKQYRSNPHKWSQWQGDIGALGGVKYRVVGIITPGTKYHFTNIGAGSYESGDYPFTIVMDSGAFKGMTLIYYESSLDAF